MDDEFDYSHPRTEVHFGRGRRDETGPVTAEHGDDALVVTTRNAMQEAGFLDDALTSLSEADVSAAVFDSVEPNPTVANVVDCVSTGVEADADVVVALGGGSVMDVAKTSAVCLAEYDGAPTVEEVWRFASGDEPVRRAAPVVALPSTSGTGSHVDPWAVVTLEEERAKVGFGGRPLVPRDAVVDPEIPAEMPPALAARTGFDALCHLTEAYVSEGRDPLTDANARRGIELVQANIRDAVEGDEDAREMMAVADTLAGFCETTSGVVATHALAHSISAYEPSVAHGQALASVAAEVAEHNTGKADDATKYRYGEIAELMGLPVADRKLDAPLAAETYETYAEDLGLDASVGDLVDEDPETLAANAAEYMGIALDNNPVDLSEDDLVSVLEDAY